MYIKKSNAALIKALAQKEYDQKILKTIDAEERRIRKFLNKYNSNSLLEVYDSMPEQKGIFVTKYELTDEEYAKMWEDSKNNLGRIEPDETGKNNEPFFIYVIRSNNPFLINNFSESSALIL